MRPDLSAYITLDGQARQALEYYRSALGGEVVTETFARWGVPAAPGRENDVVYGVLRTRDDFVLRVRDHDGLTGTPGTSESAEANGQGAGPGSGQAGQTSVTAASGQQAGPVAGTAGAGTTDETTGASMSMTAGNRQVGATAEMAGTGSVSVAPGTSTSAGGPRTPEIGRRTADPGTDQGTDDSTDRGTTHRTVHGTRQGPAWSLCLNGEDETRLRSCWDGLARDAQVVEPLQESPWGDLSGELVDPFGVRWVVNIGSSE